MIQVGGAKPLTTVRPTREWQQGRNKGETWVLNAGELRDYQQVVSFERKGSHLDGDVGPTGGRGFMIKARSLQEDWKAANHQDSGTSRGHPFRQVETHMEEEQQKQSKLIRAGHLGIKEKSVQIPVEEGTGGSK